VLNDTSDSAPATAAPEAPAAASAPRPASGSPASSVKPAARTRRKFSIALYHAWCKRCSICGEFCPTKAIVNDELGVPWVTDEDKCVGCMQCVFRCPDFCVEVFERPAGQEKKVGSGVQKAVGKAQ
jgi:2-oxoglutarate ferredoxin oxidoreductase subunit delta